MKTKLKNIWSERRLLVKLLIVGIVLAPVLVIFIACIVELWNEPCNTTS